MSKQNNLAIIIPAYKAKFLAAALDSIAAQTCQDFTLYIGDDCSPNNLKEIVAHYRDKINLVYKRFDTNLGGKDLVAQWERCIDMTQGEEWLWLFSDDDVMEPLCVEEFYRSLEKTKASYDLYHFNVKIINDKGLVTNIPETYPQDLDNYSFYKGKLKSKFASLVVENIFSREVYCRFNGFKKFDLAWGSDTATWVLFSERKGFHTISGSFIHWRCSGENISPDVSIPIAERKVEALSNFFTWGYAYFSSRGQNCFWANLRAMINRMTGFCHHISKEKYKRAILKFCDVHHCKLLYPILYLFIINRKAKA